MPAVRPNLMVIAGALGCLSTLHAQHYCLPNYCTSKHAVVGKYTSTASDPRACYDWFFKYLNNVVPGSHNQGKGYRNTTSIQGAPIVETFDTSKSDVLAMENNECGLTMGLPVNGTRPMTAKEKALVAKGQRLPTGELHQCPCAVEGRAHIINATNKHSVENASLSSGEPHYPPISPAEGMWIQAGGLEEIFGLHTVKCAFHSSGPCQLEQVEEGVARAWKGNFSSGYVPLMNNNMMLWTPTLGPLLDLFLANGVDFYPMRWKAPTESGTREIYSVIASPCGKVLIEVAAPDAGGRPMEHFHQRHMARAVFKQWNEPASQPLVPLRMSRAVTPALMEKMLEFYGASGSSSLPLGFHTEVLLDEKDVDGTRAVTLRMSESATVHLQIWAIPEPEEPEPWAPDPVGGFAEDFQASRTMNQVSGKPLPRAEGFCSSGEWSVARYNWYVLQTHEATLASIPANSSTLTPPAGNDQNVFMDDHFSWDCTAEECNVAAGVSALYKSGAHITFSSYTDPASGSQSWWPYSHDPAGYGIELHWHHVPKDFQPEGEVPPICFTSRSDGTCPGSSAATTFV